jgi:hypothetical protein
MSIQDSKQKADQLRKAKQFDEALIICQKLWEDEKSAWNGFFVALCLRQTNQLDDCRKFHQLFPNMQAMKTERLWLDYNQCIKNCDYHYFLDAGKKILVQLLEMRNELLCKVI